MKSITVEFGRKAEKQLRKLPLPILNKLEKQINFLKQDMQHPSLRLKKMQGSPYYEARIDYHYRFRFVIQEKKITIVTVGPHDEGLGKK